MSNSEYTAPLDSGSWNQGGWLGSLLSRWVLWDFMEFSRREGGKSLEQVKKEQRQWLRPLAAQEDEEV